MCWVQLIQSFAEPFPTIASLYPSVMRDFEQGLKKCQPIMDQNFRRLKQQICEFVELSSRTMELDDLTREQLLRLVVEGGLQEVKGFLDGSCQDSGSSKKTKSGFWGWTKTFVSGFFSKGDGDDYVVALVQGAVKETVKAVRKIDDCRFLSDIVKREIVQTSELSRLAEEAQVLAMSYLGSTISSLVDKTVSSVQRNQEKRCIADINTELSNLEKAEQHKEMLQFIYQVNRASNQAGCV